MSPAASREGHVHAFPTLQHEHLVRALVGLGVGHLEETEIAAIADTGINPRVAREDTHSSARGLSALLKGGKRQH